MNQTCVMNYALMPTSVPRSGRILRESVTVAHIDILHTMCRNAQLRLHNTVAGLTNWPEFHRLLYIPYDIYGPFSALRYSTIVTYDKFHFAYWEAKTGKETVQYKSRWLKTVKRADSSIEPCVMILKTDTVSYWVSNGTIVILISYL